MGVVWLAHDDELELSLALKFLPEEIARDAEAVASLKRETRRGLELAHPNIVKTYGFLRDEETAAIAMEYVEGKTLLVLKAEREERPWFEVKEVEQWIFAVCEALDYAHNRPKVIHRDLKPANIMLSDRGEIKITDFGVAQVLQDSYSRVSHRVMGTGGTLAYMSPQQAMGEPPGVTDDIYSLGATLYHLITGKAPFGGNPNAIMFQIQEKQPPPMSQRRKELWNQGGNIPARWEETIAACLAKDPAKRPRNASEIAMRLRAKENAPQPGPAPAMVARPKDSAVRRERFGNLQPVEPAVPARSKDLPAIPPPPRDKRVGSTPRPRAEPPMRTHTPATPPATRPNQKEEQVLPAVQSGNKSKLLWWLSVIAVVGVSLLCLWLINEGLRAFWDALLQSTHV